MQNVHCICCRTLVFCVLILCQYLVSFLVLLFLKCCTGVPFFILCFSLMSFKFSKVLRGCLLCLFHVPISCVFVLCLFLVSLFKCCSGVPQIWVRPTCCHPLRKAQIRPSRTALPCTATTLHVSVRTTACARVVHMPGWVAESPRQPGKQGHAVF